MGRSGILTFFNVFCAGLLAGEELVIRFGVRGPLASLDQRPHILLRQALIRTLRVLVPSIFMLAFVSGVAATVALGSDQGWAPRCAGVLALLTFIAVTAFGTVPINKAAFLWNPDAPPGNWKSQIATWEKLDTVRCWAAVAAFAFFLIAVASRV